MDTEIIGAEFTFNSRTYKAIKVYLAAGFIPSVVGLTTVKGKDYTTCARLADVDFA